MPRAKHSIARSKRPAKRRESKHSSQAAQGRSGPCLDSNAGHALPARLSRLAETRGALRGYRFVARGKDGIRIQPRVFCRIPAQNRQSTNFFSPAPPECMVFAFLEPVQSASYQRLVAAEGSLLRRTVEYIGWLTHRRPRFEFSENRPVVLVRHFSMGHGRWRSTRIFLEISLSKPWHGWCVAAWFPS